VKAATLVIAAALVFGAGGWKQVTSSGGSNVDQVSLARTPDGVLHVAWQRATAPNSYQLIHTMISPTGQIGLAMSLIVNGWVGVQNPSLVVEADHLRVPLGHYGYDPGIASNAAGQAMLAWYSNATGHLGVYAQGVNPANGAPLGSAINMPGTANMSVGMIGRTRSSRGPAAGSTWPTRPATRR
jgi:hypothetical protein